MEIFFTELYKKEFQENLHMSPSHIKQVIEKPYKKHKLESDDLQIDIYLGPLVNDNFYLLVVTEEKNGKIMVFNAFKILKAFIDEEENIIDPFLILQKFVWKFGFVISIGNQLSRFIYKEEVLYPKSVERKQLVKITSIRNHAGVGGQHIKIIPQNDKILVKFFLAYYIDLNRYKAWLSSKLEEDIASIAVLLKEKLLSCRPGKEDWKKYEDICLEITEYLFRDSFRNYNAIIQPKTVDGLERRDLLVVNDIKDNISFWNLIREEFESKHIIFEFKNLVKEIGKDEVYQVDDYTNKAIGRFAVIYSRKGLSKSGKESVKRKYNDDKKVMILNCTDDDLLKMLELRRSGKDPIEVLRNKKIEFEISY